MRRGRTAGNENTVTLDEFGALSDYGLASKLAGGAFEEAWLEELRGGGVGLGDLGSRSGDLDGAGGGTLVEGRSGAMAFGRSWV